MKGIYCLAGIAIEVESLNRRVQELLRPYSHEGPACFSVRTTQEDIEWERRKSQEEEKREGRAPQQWSDAYLEELAVYRKIAESLPFYDAFLFHGSAVAVDGEAYLFTAKSGTGKSTHTRLWRALFGERAVMINDDKPLIRLQEEGPVIYGTPYDGKHHLSSPVAVPLKAVCILRRGEENHISPISVSDALPDLMQQMYRPMDPAALVSSLQLLDRLTKEVKLYCLYCNRDISAARTAYEGMSGK